MRITDNSMQFCSEEQEGLKEILNVQFGEKRNICR